MKKKGKFSVELDYSEQIHYLSILIKCLVENHKLSKDVVIDDFIDIIREEWK